MQNLSRKFSVDIILSVLLFIDIINLNSAINNTTKITAILRSNSVNRDGYEFGYKLNDGQQRNETGYIKEVMNAEGQLVKVIVVSGEFSFIGTNGKIYHVIYTADEFGFHPTVTQAPPPPETLIDPNCLKSLCG